MESTQTTQRRVRYQFEIFCMKVIDGERCDYLRKLMKKMEWESSFSDLPETVLTSLCTFDSDPAEQYIFHVYGHQIPIRNDRLAEILLALGDEGYSILLLYYSLQLQGSGDRLAPRPVPVQDPEGPEAPVQRVEEADGGVR